MKYFPTFIYYGFELKHERTAGDGKGKKNGKRERYSKIQGDLKSKRNKSREREENLLQNTG